MCLSRLSSDLPSGVLRFGQGAALAAARSRGRRLPPPAFAGILDAGAPWARASPARRG